MIDAYAAGDIETCLSFMADDVILRNNVDGNALPEAGPAVGIEQARARFKLMFQSFELRTFKIVWLSGDAHYASGIIRASAHHREARETLDALITLRARMRDGAFVLIDEISDREYYDAFIRLISRVPQPPQVTL